MNYPSCKSSALSFCIPPAHTHIRIEKYPHFILQQFVCLYQGFMECEGQKVLVKKQSNFHQLILILGSKNTLILSGHRWPKQTWIQSKIIRVHIFVWYNQGAYFFSLQNKRPQFFLSTTLATSTAKSLGCTFFLQNQGTLFFLQDQSAHFFFCRIRVQEFPPAHQFVCLYQGACRQICTIGLVQYRMGQLCWETNGIMFTASNCVSTSSYSYQDRKIPTFYLVMVQLYFIRW